MIEENEVIFKKKEKKKRKSFNLPLSMIKQIDDLADEKGIEKSEIAERAFKILFDMLEKEKG